MATNGTANGHDDEEFSPDLSQHFDIDFTMPLGAYVGFEQVVGTLMWACVESDLVIYSVNNTVDTMTMERAFTGFCVPAAADKASELSAQIEFTWPAEYTALSLQGDEAICSLYHPDSEPCEHREGSALLFLELRVTYRLPQSYVQRLNSDEGIEATARRVREVFAEVVDHENIVQVDAKASYSGQRLRLTEIHAHHFWLLEEELQDFPLLGTVFLSIANEMRDVMERFAREFSGGVGG